MNKKRLDIVAKWLEAGAPEKKGVAHFDMREWKCGSVCCIGGAACEFFGHYSSRDAAELLGLSELQASMLFFPHTQRANVSTPKEAARVVRKLMETGVVDWDILRPLDPEQMRSRMTRMDKVAAKHGDWND